MPFNDGLRLPESAICSDESGSRPIPCCHRHIRCQKSNKIVMGADMGVLARHDRIILPPVFRRAEEHISITVKSPFIAKLELIVYKNGKVPGSLSFVTHCQAPKLHRILSCRDKNSIRSSNFLHRRFDPRISHAMDTLIVIIGRPHRLPVDIPVLRRLIVPYVKQTAHE